MKGNAFGNWCGTVKGRTQKEKKFSDCAWKKCPYNVSEDKKYSLYEKNPKVAIKETDYELSIIIGDTPIPLNVVASWTITLSKLSINGQGTNIGVVPADIDQNDGSNFCNIGWFYDCFQSVLHSKPPHSYKDKQYGPRNTDGQYVHTGSVIGVVMNTINAELSFSLNGVSLGVAYEGIPLDKPLVPCAVLGHKKESVGLDISAPIDYAEDYIAAPKGLTVKNETYEGATLAWEEVDGVLGYQIKVDESETFDYSLANEFIKMGLKPETEYNFAVRASRGHLVSEWSNIVRGRTQKLPDFTECIWKECPGNVDEELKYSVEKGSRLARQLKDSGIIHSTIIGDRPFPLGTVTMVGIKVVKTNEDGSGVYIGVAPSDIDQNRGDNEYKCGWYFYCYDSSLRSGPPQNSNYKHYGPYKDYRKYVHSRDTVGIVMDTTKGKLSYVLNRENCGVAYEGIPLDKPLVPCVLLKYEGDAVEIKPSKPGDESCVIS